MSERESSLPTYETLERWRRVHRALPQRLQIAPPWPVREEWQRAGRFDMHLDRWSCERPTATVVVVHGAGGHGRMLAPYGALCRRLGLEAVAPDLPGYGLTRVPSKRALVYDDWREALCAVVESEARRGPPVIVFGLSMGGLLAYDAAALTRRPRGLVATCLLDPRLPQVRRAMTRWPVLGDAMQPLLTAAPSLTDGLPVPLRCVGNMGAVTNDPALSRAIAADPRAGGNWMPARFLRTFATSAPAVPPESFDVCPVLLAHPAADRWTDVSVSRLFFDRIGRVPTEVVLLENGGHFPVESPAHEQLADALGRFAATVAGAAALRRPDAGD